MKTYKERKDLMKDLPIDKKEIQDLTGKSGFGGTATNAASGGTAGSMCQSGPMGSGDGTGSATMCEA